MNEPCCSRYDSFWGFCNIHTPLGKHPADTGLYKMGRDTSKVHIEEQSMAVGYSTPKEPRYTLDQLWPYHGFVKPIHELATPHLENIVEMFRDGERYVLRSNGSPRSKEEEMQLRRRVGVVKDVLRTRIATETTEKHTNMSRRIKDLKIRLATVRDRRNQMYNAPDAAEYQDVIAGCLSLLIDIQMELNL